MDTQAAVEAALHRLNTEDECHSVEAKTSSELGFSVLTTVCAFANKDGGTILLGVRQAKEGKLFPKRYEAVGVDNPEKVAADLATACHEAFNRPVIPDKIDTTTINGKTVILVEIPKMKPHPQHLYLKRFDYPAGVFLRIGPTDQAGYTRDELASLIDEQGTHLADATPLPNATASDLDPAAIRDYIDRKTRCDLDCDIATVDEPDLLRGLGCAQVVDGKVVPTMAGILLFGKPLSIRGLFPLARVDFIRVPGVKWRSDPGQGDDDLTRKFRGALIKVIEEVRTHILGDLSNSSSYADGLHREEVPQLHGRIIREIVVNAIMHRSYEEQSPVRIVRYENRLEVQNPGSSLVPVDQLGRGITRNRNGAIAAVLQDLRLAENKGTGIGYVRRLMREYGYPLPVFDDEPESRKFTATLVFRPIATQENRDWLASFGKLKLNEDEYHMLFVTREIGAMNSTGCRSVLQCSEDEASLLLRGLSQKGLLIIQGQGAGVYYKPSPAMENPAAYRWNPAGLAGNLTGFQKNPTGIATDLTGIDAAPDSLTVEPLKEDLQDAVRSLGKKASVAAIQAVILRLCAWKALNSAELGLYLSRNPAWVRETYVKPLIDGALLRPTASKFSPGVRYATTPAGHSYLAQVGDPPDD